MAKDRSFKVPVYETQNCPVKRSYQWIQISLCFLTETWVQNNTDEFVLKAAAPDGYWYIHRSRPDGRKCGGVGVIFLDSVKCRDLTIESKLFKSFELMSLCTDINGQRITFHVIYRPPPSQTNALSSKMFHKDFADFLESACPIQPNYAFFVILTFIGIFRAKKPLTFHKSFPILNWCNILSSLLITVVTHLT